MRIAIVGPGALGMAFGALLHQGGHGVEYVARRAERARRIEQEGITVREGRQEFTFHPRARLAGETAGVVDLGLLCVKSQDTPHARSALEALPGAPPVATLQNGLGNLERLLEWFGPERVFGGATALGATRTQEREVEILGRGPTYFGPACRGALESVRRIVRGLGAPGLDVHAADDAEAVIWRKLFINLGVNATTGLLSCPNGRVADDVDLVEVARACIAEAEAVATMRGRPEGVAADMSQVLEVAQRTRHNRSSLLQDLDRGSETEIEALNGAIWRLGCEHGVPTPTNEVLTRLVRAKTRNQRGDPS